MAKENGLRIFHRFQKRMRRYAKKDQEIPLETIEKLAGVSDETPVDELADNQHFLWLLGAILEKTGATRRLSLTSAIAKHKTFGSLSRAIERAKKRRVVA